MLVIMAHTPPTRRPTRQSQARPPVPPVPKSPSASLPLGPRPLHSSHTAQTPDSPTRNATHEPSQFLLLLLLPTHTVLLLSSSLSSHLELATARYSTNACESALHHPPCLPRSALSPCNRPDLHPPSARFTAVELRLRCHRQLDFWPLPSHRSTTALPSGRWR